MIFDKSNKMEFYKTNYNIICLGVIDKSRRIILGKDGSRRICRFCGKDETTTTFIKIAHAFPEMIGNKSLFSYYECDICNAFFGDNLENHFGNLFQSLRTIMRIKGKNGIPDFKIKRTSISVTDDGFEIKASDITIDKNNRNITIFAESKPYIPLAAYKLLIKMLITIAPTCELDNFKILNSCLFTKCIYYKPCIIYYTFMPGMENDNIGYILFKRKDLCHINVPQYTFVLAFGNVILQIIIPMINTGNSEIFDFTQFPANYDYHEVYGETIYGLIDCTSSTIKDDRHKMQMRFDSIEEIDNNSVTKQ